MQLERILDVYIHILSLHFVFFSSYLAYKFVFLSHQLLECSLAIRFLSAGMFDKQVGSGSRRCGEVKELERGSGKRSLFSIIIQRVRGRRSVYWMFVQERGD